MRCFAKWKRTSVFWLKIHRMCWVEAGSFWVHCISLSSPPHPPFILTIQWKWNRKKRRITIDFCRFKNSCWRITWTEQQQQRKTIMNNSTVARAVALFCAMDHSIKYKNSLLVGVVVVVIAFDTKERNYNKRKAKRSVVLICDENLSRSLSLWSFVRGVANEGRNKTAVQRSYCCVAQKKKSKIYYQKRITQLTAFTIIFLLSWILS